MSKRELLMVLCCWACAAQAQNPPLTIANDSFPNAVLGQEYTQLLRFSGGCESDLTAKPGFTVLAGTLPPGLKIEVPSNAGSILTGIPTVIGKSTFTLKVSDTCGNSATKDFTLTVVKTAAALTLPQFAFGDGWYSAVYFTNASAKEVSFPVNFIGDDGQPLVLPSVGQSSVMLTLPPQGTSTIEARNTGTLVQGYVSVSLPDGVTGYGVFRSSVPGQIDQEAVVMLAPSAGVSMLIWDDTEYISSVAVVNLSSNDGTLNIVARDFHGTILGTAAVPLAANRKIAARLRDVPGLAAIAGNRGSAEFSMAGGNFAMLALRFNNGAFTSIPTFGR
jgi:hypothetical protein